MFDSPFIVPVALFVMGGLAIILTPITRALSRRVETRSKGVDPELVARLERMEHAIDSIAVEVERISEAQRFTTKLLADRARIEAFPREPS